MEPNNEVPSGESLPALAAKIKEELAKCDEAARSAVSHAVSAGKLLIQAKQKAGHGNWGNWLRDQFNWSKRTAEDYMRLARHEAELLNLDPQHAANLSIRGALGYLANSSKKTVAATPIINALSRLTMSVSPKSDRCVLDGKTAAIYDGHVGIQHPLDLSISGLVTGRMLLEFLKTIGSETPSFERSENDVVVTAGDAMLTVPVQDAVAFPFAELRDDDAQSFSIEESFIAGLRSATISMGEDTDELWRWGVTCELDDQQTTFWASDDKTMTRVRVPSPELGKAEAVVSLPPAFCKLLLDISLKGDRPVRLLVWDVADTKDAKDTEDIKYTKTVACTFEGGLRLFAHGIAPGISEYSVQAAKFDPPLSDMVDIAPTFKKALARAANVVHVLRAMGLKEEPYTVATLEPGQLVLRTASSKGDVEDQIAIGNHAVVGAVFTPDILSGALSDAKKFCCTTDRMVFASDDYTHWAFASKGHDILEEIFETADPRDLAETERLLEAERDDGPMTLGEYEAGA